MLSVIYRIKEKIHDYKLRHLSLGKVHYKGKTFDDGDFEIKKISWDIHWQTDTYLLVIIRDYLKNFINNSPAIGNCVFTKEELDPKNKAYYEVRKENDSRWEKWKKLVNDTANEFDGLYKMQLKMNVTWNDIEWQKLKNKAFKDLAFIFDDLNW